MDRIDFRKFSPSPVVGVDEVGRGCLAGPVFAAAVCFRDTEHLVENDFVDSKTISENRREVLADIIFKSHWFGIGMASVDEIDQLNILWASQLAMVRALKSLELKMGNEVGHVLVDGHLRIREWGGRQTAIVKGDQLCSLISAASIVAKVSRDRLMKQIDSEFPKYEFSSNKGYPSQSHRTALQHWGITPYHRKTFKGVREWVATGHTL